MREEIFEFKGTYYRKIVGAYGTAIEPMIPVPRYHSHNAPKEVVPDHLRNLNKSQLRAHILALEKTIEELRPSPY